MRCKRRKLKKPAMRREADCVMRRRFFDENAALLVTTNLDLIDALRRHAWLEVFVAQRDVFVRDCAVMLFGHALMEKLVAPYKAITAHMLVVPGNGCVQKPRDKHLA